MIRLVSLLVAASVCLAGCGDPAPQVRQFASEDACEDAGMSDAYCDQMFPEADEQSGSSILPFIFGYGAAKAFSSSKPKSKPSYSRPATSFKPMARPSSSSRPSFRASRPSFRSGRR